MIVNGPIYHLLVFLFLFSLLRKRPISIFVFISTAGKPNIDPLPPGGSLGKSRGRDLWITIPHSGSVDHLAGEKNDENNHSEYKNPFLPSPHSLTVKPLRFETQSSELNSMCGFLFGSKMCNIIYLQYTAKNAQADIRMYSHAQQVCSKLSTSLMQLDHKLAPSW